MQPATSSKPKPLPSGVPNSDAHAFAAAHAKTKAGPAVGGIVTVAIGGEKEGNDEEQQCGGHERRTETTGWGHVFQREPPRLAEPVRKRGRQVHGERHAVLPEHGIGRGDDILATAVKRQAGKSVGAWQRHRPPAHFIHRDEIEFPALQRPDRAVEKLWRDFARLVGLERRRTPRAHPFEPQDNSGAAGLPLLQPEVAAEIGELHPAALQDPDIQRQRPAPNYIPARPQQPDCHYPLLTFPCEGRAKSKIVNNFL